MSATAERPRRRAGARSATAPTPPAEVDEEDVDRAIGQAVRRLLSLSRVDPDGEASLEQVGGILAEEGRRLVKGTQVVLSVVPSDRPTVFRCIGAAGPWAEALRGREWPLNARMLHGRAMLEQVALETLDGPRESALPDVFGEMKAGRLVPVAAGMALPDGRVGMGVISFWRPEAVPFTATQRAVIDTYARLIGLSLLRSEARLATSRLVTRLEVNADIAEELAASLEPEAVVDTIIRRVAGLVRAERAILLRVDGDEVEVVGAYDAGGNAPAPGFRFALTPHLRRVISAGKPDVESPPDVKGLPSVMKSQVAHVRHRVTLPLAVRGTMVAVLSMSRRRDEVFTPRDVEDLNQFGTRAALALRNSELYADRRHSQDEALTALNEIARHVESTDALPELLGKVTGTIARLVSARRVAFWRLAPDQRSIEMVANAHGFGEDLVSSMRSVACDPAGATVMDEVLFRDGVNHRTLTPGSPLSTREGRQFLRAGVREVLLVPWRAGDVRLGLLGAYDSTRVGGFTPEDAWVLQLAALASGLVSQLRAAEERIRALGEDEAGRLREHVDRMTALEQVKSDFLKLASHELRTPLALVKGYLEMVADGSLDRPAFEGTIPVIQGRVEQMNRVINEMLETARLEEGRLALDARRVDLRLIVQAAARSAEALLTPRHSLSVRVPSRPVLAHLDESRTQTILANLLDNAIKFSPDGGEVRCTLTTGSGFARVHVSDRGLGIAREDLPSLFKRFGRLVTSDNSHISGTGLGLYISRELARMQGGDISVRSVPRRGTRFILRLPLG